MVYFGADRGCRFCVDDSGMLQRRLSFEGRCLNQTPARGCCGFTKGVTPCHATLTETLRVDRRACAGAGVGRRSVSARTARSASHRHRRRRLMRASKDGERPCDACVVGVLRGVCNPFSATEASRGKGMEISLNALKLLDQLDLKRQNRHRRRDVLSKIDRGEASPRKAAATYFAVKDNQKNLRENIATRFQASRFFPLVSFEGVIQKARWAHRTAFDRRAIAANAAEHRRTIASSVKHICRVTPLSARQEERPTCEGAPRRKYVYLDVPVLPRWRGHRPKRCCPLDRGHVGHRNHASKQTRSSSARTATANRSDDVAAKHAFPLLASRSKFWKSVSPSPTRAIEQFQDDRNKALRLFAG